MCLLELYPLNQRSGEMICNRVVFLVMGVAIFLFTSVSSADVPHMINYQGKLTTASGGSVNDTVQMTFSIYPDTLGSPADWSETQGQVVVENGIFNVLLGAVVMIPSAIFDGNVKYLGVQVEADPEMRPLKPMVSVAYAYRAVTVDGGGVSSGWVDDGGVVRLETDTDSVGIGTTAPTAKLDVVGDLVVSGKATIGTGNTNIGDYAFVAGQNNAVGGPGTTIGGGLGNTAASGWTTVSGGLGNSANNVNASIGGGQGNTADGAGSTISGGEENYAALSMSTVGGGSNNAAVANKAVVGGGGSNQVLGDYSAILGGYANNIANTANYSYLFGISSQLTQDSTFMVDMPHIRFGDETDGYEFPATDGAIGQIMQTNGSGQLGWIDMPGGGGWTDDGTVVRLSAGTDLVGIGTTAPSEKLEVSGNIKASGTLTSGSSITIDGSSDRITATSGTIDFDNENIVTTGKATIGYNHTNTGDYAFVAGQNNTASAAGATVGGGEVNSATSGWATVSGGTLNFASNSVATVGGGYGNEAQGGFSTVAGGKSNTAQLIGSTVGGGFQNLVSGLYSTIAGGYADTLLAEHSYLFGIASKLTLDSTFMVDMPHVRFGDETDGYEFPVDDGTTGQVMQTDGSGQLNWVDLGGGSNWTVNDSVLYTTNFLGIARGGAGNAVYGDSAHTMVNLGIACTTGTDGVHFYYSTVGGGYGNRATSNASFVGGGIENRAMDYYATVGGGNGNTASENNATVGGGSGNTASQNSATVAGGYSNTAGGLYSAVGGGNNNEAQGYYSTIAGGYYGISSDTGATVNGGSYNVASGRYAAVAGGSYNKARGEYSVVAGGGGASAFDSNFALGSQSTVSGGHGNAATGPASTVGGGWDNTASQAWATIGGGWLNRADDLSATVGGGHNNRAYGSGSTIGGGDLNVADSVYTTIAGGSSNQASEDIATVGGGKSNWANGFAATIAGGFHNQTWDTASTVGGGWFNAAGRYNTVSGGRYNGAAGYASTVPGGYADTAYGDYSMAAGGQVRITSAGDYTFAFGRDFITSTPNAVIFHNSVNEIKVGIGVTNPGNILTVQQGSTTDPVADAWTVHSSREYKKDIRELTPLEYRQALEKVVSVPVVKFRYKVTDTKEKIGLIAEEAPSEIVAEGNNKAISINEYVSLLHAALKAQQEQIDALKAAVNELTKE